MKKTLTFLAKLATLILVAIIVLSVITWGVFFDFSSYLVIKSVISVCLLIVLTYVSCLNWEDGKWGM